MQVKSTKLLLTPWIHVNVPIWFIYKPFPNKNTLLLLLIILICIYFIYLFYNLLNYHKLSIYNYHYILSFTWWVISFFCNSLHVWKINKYMKNFIWQTNILKILLNCEEMIIKKILAYAKLLNNVVFSAQ